MRIDTSRGLPDSFFTPTRAIATGLFVAGAVVIGGWTYASLARWATPEPAVAPACYGAERANHVPGREPIPPDPRRRQDNVWYGARGSHNIDRMTKAELVCTPTACDRRAWEQYRSALFWYLAERLQRTRRLDARYGDSGLRRARELFASAQDRRIEQGLRERYKAGIFRIKDIRQNKDAISILLQPDGELRPCRSGAAG